MKHLFVISLLAFLSLSFAHEGQAQGCVLACPNPQIPVPISIDNDCVDTLSIGLLGVVPSNCTDNFLIQIMDDNQNDLGDTITQEMINNEYMVIVTNLDDMQNCMFMILVIDKQKPTIDSCPPDVTFECSFDIDTYDASADVEVTECSNFTVSSFDDVVFSANCVGDTISKYNRTYLVVDEYNNATSCVQMISLIKADLMDVTFPDDITGEFALDCSPAPDTTPANTGAPLIGGMEISNGLFCNLSFSYVDQVVPLCSGSYKIFRVFTVTDWCSNNETTTGQQVIEVLDKTPPVVTAPLDVVVSTSSEDCDADVFIQPAGMMEDCSNIVSFRTQWAFGTMPTNGGMIENLPIGTHEIEFIMTNDCDSIGRDTMLVTVVDNEPPNTICHQSVSIPVASNGEVIISAESLDAASYDNCGPIWFKAKRMTAPGGYTCTTDDNPLHMFNDVIKFCCEDIPSNNIMVILRAYDVPPVDGPVSDNYLAGRWNECMIEVQVQDKIPPTIQCPTNLEVSCEFNFDPDSLHVFGVIAKDPLDVKEICVDDPGDNIIGLNCIGVDGLALDNCSVTINELKSVVIDSCGIGTVTRTFTATDNGGFSSNCTQIISIVNYNLFDESMIDWPDEYETQNICSVDLLDPDDLPQPFSEPVLTGGPCDLVTFDHEDMVFDFSQFDQACFKIVRKWTVIDWCQFDSNGEGKWEYYQTIKSLNSVPPTITSTLDPINICSIDENCGSEIVSFLAEATDDCSSENTLTWQYQIDVDNDLVIDQSFNSGPGSSVAFDYEFGLGTHRVLFTVFDKCSNKTTREQLIHITSCTGPSAKCLYGLSTSLMAVDLDDNGEVDWGMINIWASDFDAGSDHPCDLGVRVAFSANPNDTLRTFDCNTLGEQTIGLYAIDANGLTDVCFTFIDIQDNSSVCPIPDPGNTSTGFIAGSVETETTAEVGEAMIYLNGSELAPNPTTNTGSYAFTNMPFGGSYEVEPKKDGDDMNGVSTLDLLRIQQHLLGIQNLETPYQYIAADANHSNNVTAIDILELRKLILGIYDELPDNTSWRFIDASYTFIDPNDPLDEPFPESYQVAPFSNSMPTVDFIGVKIGDLNGNVQANLNQNNPIITRSASDDLKVLYYMEEDGALVFEAKELSKYATAQFSLAWDPTAFEADRIVTGERFDDYSINSTQLENGQISFAWYDVDHDYRTNEVLFKLIPKVASTNATSFKLTSEPTVIESSLKTGEIAQIMLMSGDLPGHDPVKLYQNTPNPFQTETEIQFYIPHDEEIVMSIYDMSGKLVWQRTEDRAAGLNRMRISTQELSARGVFVYELKTSEIVKTRRMIIE